MLGRLTLSRYPKTMRWVDVDSYVGVCRRNARRARLQNRRRVDCAQPSPPPVGILLAQLRLAQQLGLHETPRMKLRLDAATDLAGRLDDPLMCEAFRALGGYAQERLAKA